MNNSFYSKEELIGLGFCEIGSNVLISKKASIYNASKISIGNNVRIDDFCILSGTISIGNFIHIAAYSALYGGECGIEINDYSNISSKNSIYAISDDYSGMSMTNPMIPDKYKKIYGEKVVFEKHVIIGSSCVVLPGVVLGEGSSFGAMSLINKSSEPWTINAGIPFRKIKDRSKEILKLEEQFIKEVGEKCVNQSK
ncbi:galactoside O-acetyltransferase [Desulfonispora thiosulfatigenes DSM 11270]|uniref:Galactoside O-acetyltransferase n=1 Tax=Desulfonispora thiosulfatigenes DSM 11270 TaxID=656914 RepID=A0A1W1V5L5_DESTI|nr:galactoside O-acetyltransferase [Desulfonispora thiosulfatigenes]SMB88727.1 galactoside O-acetyltransferase [Desulfonispora thiosulfatigenes DSM 11270]